MSEPQIPVAAGQADQMTVVCASQPISSANGNSYLRLLSGALGMMGVRYGKGGYRALWFGRYDLVHIHWPENAVQNGTFVGAVLKAIIILGGMVRARFQGRPIVWTVHNLGAHQPRWKSLEPIVWRCFRYLNCGAIFLSESSIAPALVAYPWLEKLPRMIVPHGHYKDVAAMGLTKPEARKRHGIGPNRKVIVHFGNIDLYKGVLDLVRCFSALDDEDAMLVLAGHLSADLLASEHWQEFEHLIRTDERIVTRFATLDDVELSSIVMAADVAVLPYRRILNSGSALYALSCNTPVYAPNLGTLNDLQDELSADWVGLYDPPLTPVLLAQGLAWACSTPRSAEAGLDEFSWPLIAEKHKAFFLSMCR